MQVTSTADYTISSDIWPFGIRIEKGEVFSFERIARFILKFMSFKERI